MTQFKKAQALFRVKKNYVSEAEESGYGNGE